MNKINSDRIVENNFKNYSENMYINDQNNHKTLSYDNSKIFNNF